LLRAGHGFTGRANSALPVGDPGSPLPAAVSSVEQWYRARGLPARFQVPLVGSPPLDDLLSGLGYEPVDEASVLVADLLPLLGGPPGERSEPGGTVPEHLELRLDEAPDDGWLAQYHYRGGGLPTGARAVIEAGGPLAFASVRSRPTRDAEPGEVLAIARGAVHGRWLGVTAVEVVTGARRQGLPTAMLLALAIWAEGLGALAAYLQVAVENEAAYRLYARAGFVEHHRYHYRRLTL
jgi:GNAT superfamily N-acetyltransferase